MEKDIKKPTKDPKVPKQQKGKVIVGNKPVVDTVDVNVTSKTEETLPRAVTKMKRIITKYSQHGTTKKYVGPVDPLKGSTVDSTKGSTPPPYKNFRKEEVEPKPKKKRYNHRHYLNPAEHYYNSDNNNSGYMYRTDPRKEPGKDPFKVVTSKNDGSEDKVTYHPTALKARNHIKRVTGFKPIGMFEEVEQIDELKASTLTRYRDAAMDAVMKHYQDKGDDRGKLGNRQLGNRLKGIARSMNKTGGPKHSKEAGVKPARVLATKEEVEQTNEAVLTLAQRIKRAQIMRREAPKIERAREISITRFAKDSQLKNRAEVLARRLVKKKFAGQRGYDYQKLSTSEKMAIDAMVDKKVALIHALAKRLYPVVKRKEVARMLARHQGVNATPGASPVNLVNSYEPIQEKKFPPVPKDATTGAPEKYVKGLPKSVQLARVAHSKTNAQKDPSDPSAYNDFPGDKKARERGMPPSPHTDAYHARYSKNMNEQIAGLQKKAEKSGISYGTLKKVYDRGMAAWRTGHRPGTTPQQWAFARVNSFITKGKTYHTADKDLHEEAQLNEWYIDTANKYKPSRGDSIVTNNGGRVFGRVERVDETSVYFRNQHDNRVYKTEINNVSKVDHWDGTLNENHMPSCPDYEEPPKKKTLLKRIKDIKEAQRVADSAPELYIDPYTGLEKTRKYRRPTAVSTGEKL